MKFNKTARSRATRNLAGGRAFKHENAETELVFAVLTTFLEDKFYESSDERMQRIRSLVASVPHEFTAKLAVLARREFNMRSVTIVLLAELAQIHRGDDLVKRAIINASTRVDDVIELIAYFKAQELPIPKQVKRGVRNALLKFDRYQLGKYQAKGKSVSLVDVFNLVHPKPELASVEQRKAWKDLMAGTLKSEGTVESVLSNSGEDIEENFSDLILEGKIGYMALLRNLNNVEKYKLSAKVVDKIAKRLADPEEVRKSKQLPFRFITAYDNYTGNQKVRDAIAEALEHSLANVPVFSGKTLVALDVSGSMSGQPSLIGSIFAAALAKSNKCDVWLYDTTVKTARFSTRDSMLSIAQQLRFDGGGTDTAAVFRKAEGAGYDRIFVISDNQAWVSDAQAAYRAMKRKPTVYAIDIQGYGTTDLTGENVYHFTSWSEKVFDLISLREEGVSISDRVNQVELNDMPRRTAAKRKPAAKARKLKVKHLKSTPKKKAAPKKQKKVVKTSKKVRSKGRKKAR